MLFYYDSSSYFIHVQFVVVCVYVLLNHTFEYAFCGQWFENINLLYETRKNCFRYLKLMSPLNKWYYLKNNYLTLMSKVKVQWRSLTYLERQKRYGPDKLRCEEAEEAEAEEKIRLKQYVSLRSKGRHNYDSIFRSWLQINSVCYSVSTVNLVLCNLPREQWNMVTYDRRSPNTGLIDMKYIVKGNKN